MLAHSGGIELVGDHWAARGEPRGSVLLLHGGGQRRHSWHRTGERLARSGWSAWAFDARGHGDSGWATDGDYSLSVQVDDALAVIDLIGEPPVLVGASMGGMTSLIAEGERGPLARGLVLVDIVARLEPVGVERIQSFMSAAPDGFATLAEAADAIAAYNPHRPRPKTLDGLRKNLVQREDGRWRWHWDPQFLRVGSEPEREIRQERAQRAAQSIRVPTLLVRGAHSDIVSEEGLREMQELIPHAETVEVTSAGHMIAGDDNDVFTAQLTRFVESTSPLPGRRMTQPGEAH
ncbi:alpha/beta fold hydrolase [Salinibacterium sp. ZJ450]|uniref:alpha/beta fold hydrolase n=1 Tax=Salinibacterium sp. ZJ450 TaxID=2708338 RepID=UPI001CD6524D|nr:alpha/beta hydrolase [Salinibacterium sp. ZJ450]